MDANAFSKMRSFTRAAQTQSDYEVLRSYLQQKGVDISQLSPPSAFFYTFGEKTLTVRGTEDIVDKNDKLMAELKSLK